MGHRLNKKIKKIHILISIEENFSEVKFIMLLHKKCSMVTCKSLYTLRTKTRNLIYALLPLKPLKRLQLCLWGNYCRTLEQRVILSEKAERKTFFGSEVLLNVHGVNVMRFSV